MNDILGLSLIAAGFVYFLKKTYERFSFTPEVREQPPVWLNTNLTTPTFPVIDTQKINVPDVGVPLFGTVPDSGPRTSLDAIYKKYGDIHGIDWRLLKAIALQESSENPNVTGKAGEIGLMQVLCIPNASGQCTARFNVKDWPPKKAADLFDPDYNVHIASQIFRWNLDYAGGDVNQALAIYNGGLDTPQFGYAAQVMSRYNNLLAGGRGARDPALV